MGTEKSAGIVLFRNDSGKNEFLLLKYPQGHWDFVKGKIEQNETEHGAAQREKAHATAVKKLRENSKSAIEELENTRSAAAKKATSAFEQMKPLSPDAALASFKIDNSQLD